VRKKKISIVYHGLIINIFLEDCKTLQRDRQVAILINLKIIYFIYSN